MTGTTNTLHSVWDSLRGHALQREMFRRAIGRDRLASAYLFVGPSGVGKRRFAGLLTQCLLCSRFDDTQLEACGECSACRQVLAGTHPDVVTAAPPEGKAIFPLEVIAGTKEDRGRSGLCYEISLRPMSGDRRIGIVDEVHLMNAEAANAFLKTLEEPPPFATLILITSNEDALLPTIRSRCQPVRFGALPAEDIAALLQEQEHVAQAGDAEEIAALCDGSLTTAGTLLDEELRHLRQVVTNGLASGMPSPALVKQLVDEGIEVIGGDSHTQRRNAGWVLRFAIEFYRQSLTTLLTGKPALTPAVQKFVGKLRPDIADDAERLMEKIERCLQAEQQLRRNNPARLVFETLFGEICR